MVLPYYFCLCGESYLLVSWCAGDKCVMVDIDEDLESSTGRVLGDLMIGRSGDAMCGLHHAHRDEERGFFWLSLKIKVDGFPVWTSNRQLWFDDLGLKITVSVS
jgi:hypothetical protein